jgi:pilus assembly protein CpaB
VRNIRALVVLVAALAAGAIAVVLASRWLTEQAGTVGGAKVVVAAVDIDLGTQLTPQLLHVVDWPKESVPKGAYTDTSKLLEIKEGQPARVLRISVVKGEPIVESKLAPPGATGGLASIIDKGKRAMTVSVNEIVGVAGFALPGNYVDILVSTQDDKAKEASKQISKIVLEQVLVLAVAQEAKQGETKPRVVNAVTLEVTPEQAEKIDLARSVGSLTLVLRPQVDKADVATSGVRKSQLLGGSQTEEAAPPKVVERVVEKVIVKQAPRARVVPKEKADQIEVIRGTVRSQESFTQEHK